jgi:hypothetical protein
VRAAGGASTFANAYTPAYLEKPPRFVSVSTTAALQAGLRLRTLADLERGEAVYHDFTNRLLAERGHTLPPLSPPEAGRRLARLAAQHDFTLYEHFLTDLAGHAQETDRAVRILENLEAFLDGVLSALNLATHCVVLTSDHGNLEDLSTNRHTGNPVPTLAWGTGARQVTETVRTLADLAPAILRHLGML